MFGKRFTRALAVTTVASLVMAAAAFADQTSTDGDTAVSSSNVSVASCSGLPKTFDGLVTVKYLGNAHFAGGNISVSSAPEAAGASAGLTTGGGGTLDLGTWTAASADKTIAVSLTVPADVPAGTYKVNVTASGPKAGGGTYTISDFYNVNVTVDCSAPSNAAPVIAWTANPTSANEGDTRIYTFSITDAEADTHTFFAEYPDCGTGNTLSAASIDNSLHTGTFSCLFPDGLVPAQASAVKVKVQDDGSLGSNELTADTTVSNVDPTVVAGFSAAADCQTAATLTINPDDLGVNDYSWKVNINWGDGSSEPEISRSDLDSFDVSHTYALAGTYNATVSVTDKDGGSGSDNTNSITVNQVYNVLSFFSPLDTSSAAATVKNTFKNGRVVPVKATIQDGCTFAMVDGSSSVSPRVQLTKGSVPSGGSDALETYADAGQSSGNSDLMRWSTDGFWIYNLDSKALGLTTGYGYRLDIYLGTVKATNTKWVLLAPTK